MTSARLRAAALVAALAMVGAACGSADPADEAGSDASEATASASEGAAALAALSDGVNAAPVPPAAPVATPEPGASIEPISLPETVEVLRPDLVVRTADADTNGLYSALATPGVDKLSAASAFSATLTTLDGGMREVSVLAVDHATFRPLTPEVTASAVGVWQRLAEGDILVRHDVAAELEIELGSDVDLSSTEDQFLARVGAFASNGAPPLADIIVPWDMGSRLGGGDVNTLIVATSDGESTSSVADLLVDALGGGEIEIREAPETQQAQITPGSSTSLESFSYTDLGDGQIVIDRAWVQKWITTIDLPGLGRTQCHRRMIPQLFKALDEIQAAGLYGHFKPEQFAGCWVPRHIDWNPSKPLSMHAWGIAIDFNSRDNWLGDQPQMDRRIVAIFEKWGFAWGGRWSRPDGMHFELDRIIEVS